MEVCKEYEIMFAVVALHPLVCWLHFSQHRVYCGQRKLLEKGSKQNRFPPADSVISCVCEVTSNDLQCLFF